MAALSGFGLGLTLPLFLSVLGDVVPPEEQGLAVGLRVTANRLSSAIIPILFGFLIIGIGIQSSFYVIGLVLLVPILAIVPFLFRKLNSKV